MHSLENVWTQTIQQINIDIWESVDYGISFKTTSVIESNKSLI